VGSLAAECCQRQLRAGFLCSPRKLGFPVVFWALFVAFFRELCVLELTLSRDWDLKCRMWLRIKKTFDRNIEKVQKTFCSPNCVLMPRVAALCQPYLLKLQARCSRSILLFCLCRVLCAVHPPLSWFFLMATTLTKKPCKCWVGREGGGCPVKSAWRAEHVDCCFQCLAQSVPQ